MMQELLVINPEEEEDTDTDAYWEENPNWQDEPARKNNPLAKRAMRIAAGLRKNQGLDASSALSLAWEQVRGGKKSNMIENPTRNTVLVALSFVVLAILLHKAITGGWIWANLGKPALTAPKTRQLVAAPTSQDPTHGMRFNDSTYSSTGEPLGDSGEMVGTIMG